MRSHRLLPSILLLHVAVAVVRAETDPSTPAGAPTATPSAISAAAPAPAPVRSIPLVRTWGALGDGPGEFDFPIGLALEASGTLVVSDHYNNRVQRFDADGGFLAEFPVRANPGAIAVAPSGRLYVTHFAASKRVERLGGHFVSVYDADGGFLLEWGREGPGPGEFSYPGGLTIAPDGRVFVADQTNHRIQIFEADGTFVRAWGEYGSEPGRFGGASKANSRVGGPNFVALDSTGAVWTTEGEACRVQKFLPDGTFLHGWSRPHDGPGGFGGAFIGFGDPIGAGGAVAIVADARDRLWITSVGGRVQRFDAEENFEVGAVAGQGEEPGRFIAPHGVAISPDGRRLHVADSFNHRIQTFDPEG